MALDRGLQKWSRGRVRPRLRAFPHETFEGPVTLEDRLPMVVVLGLVVLFAVQVAIAL
ncbi:MAG: hypothetical protein R3B09_04060 [Nannocystaceae bacterium]